MHAGAGLNRQRAVGRRDAGPFNQILGEAAEAVAAHFTVRAVRVDDHHASRCDIGVLRDQDAVSADAKVAITNARRQR